MSITFLVSHNDISGKVNKDEQSLNIQLRLVTYLVFQLDISGKFNSGTLSSNSPLNIEFKFLICFIPLIFISRISLFNCFLFIFKCVDNSCSFSFIIILHLSLLFSTNSFPNILIFFEYSLSLISLILYCIVISSISSFLSISSFISF